MSKKRGELLLNRRPKELDVTQFGPCPNYLDWIKLNSLVKHTKTCTASDENTERPSRGILRTQVEIIQGNITANASQLLKNEVFGMMTCDDITQVAQRDILIVMLGESWLKIILKISPNENITALRI